MRFKVEFTLYYPIISLDLDCSFDGILSYYACKAWLKSEEDPNTIIEKLPLKKYYFTIDGKTDFFYMASIPQLNTKYSGVFHITRKSGDLHSFIDIVPGENLQRMVKNRKLKDGERGSNPYKNAIVNVNFYCTDRVAYIVETTPEQKDALFELIHSIDRIGKYTRLGHGKVEKCNITETTEPIIRYAPVVAGLQQLGHSYRIMSYKPPLWKEKNVLCTRVIFPSNLDIAKTPEERRNKSG